MSDLNGLFKELEDETRFREIVINHFENAPNEIGAVMRCVNRIDAARLTYAYGEYVQTVEKFAVLLQSENPDHYKRAGALLHALYQSEIISDVELESTSEELEAGFTRINVGDAEHILPFVQFYETFHNQMLAFDLSYKFCAAYEPEPRMYDFDYLHNVCRYLKQNSNLNVDSLFMMFKSLMR
ncbi:hypothetical protein [Mesorhizobium sp. CAU 1732]|uniref:hypothetical protein n=1 Tax=Mesorhizobium sp. CAU 1732 TaxID=3140358 RepID=UPI00326012A0